MISQCRPSCGVFGRALVHHRRGPVGQRPVDDVAVPGDPADVGGAPVDALARLVVEHDVVGVRGLGEVAAGGVQDALRLPGGARGVEDEQRVARRRTPRARACRTAGRRARATTRRGPRSTAPRSRCAGPPGRARSTACPPTASSVFSFIGAGWPRRYWPSDGDQQLGLGVPIRALSAPRREPAEDHAVRRTQPRAGQHRDDGLGDHRQLDRHPVARDDAELGQRVRGLAHLALQVGVGDGAASRPARPPSGTRPARRARPRRAGRRSCRRR